MKIHFCIFFPKILVQFQKHLINVHVKRLKGRRACVGTLIKCKINQREPVRAAPTATKTKTALRTKQGMGPPRLALGGGGSMARHVGHAAHHAGRASHT